MIRPVTVSDAHELYTMLQLSFKQYEHTAVPASALTETPASLKDKISSGYQALLFIIDEQVAGMCMYRFLNGNCHFYRLCVLPQYQGRGISKQLLAEMEAHAFAKHCSYLCCESRLSNCAYYTQKGYNIYGYTEASALYFLKKPINIHKKTWQCA